MSEIDRVSNLPEKITKVDIAFCRDENFLHSVIFHGDTILQIGRSDDLVDMWGFGEDGKKGRVETMVLGEGEELLGCKFHHSEESVFGMTWIKWRPPRA